MIELSEPDRSTLESLLRRRQLVATHARRIRVVLLAADGMRSTDIAQALGLAVENVSRIRRRFLEGGVPGLEELPRSGRTDHAVPAAKRERIIQLAMSPPPAGRSRWTTRLLARAVGVGNAAVGRILRASNLKPHLTRTYKVSRDPKFVEKVEDVVGLYLDPPTHAVVLSVDEKTSIQALERTQLPLPLRQGRASRHTHDYKRHGVVDLYAALEIATGQVTHQCTESHTARDFLGFMRKVVRAYPGRELHVVLDNSSSHATDEVRAWLDAHPLVHFHFTPTSASWLNQVEGFFGILGKQSLSKTDFPSKKALRTHIQNYMASWNRNPTPFSWTKPADAIIKSHKRMIDAICDTVH